MFTNGQLIVSNRGDEPLTLVKVEPEMTGDGLKFLGAQMAGLGRKLGAEQFEPRFPPTYRLLGNVTDAEGAG